MTSKAGPVTVQSNPCVGHGHPKGLRGVLAMLKATPLAKMFDLTDATPIP